MATADPPWFDEDGADDDTDVHALDHGLPTLPRSLEPGDSVPVARWVGPTLGAVLSVARYLDEDDGDDMSETDVVIYRRSGAGWTSCGGSGGFGHGVVDGDALYVPPLAGRDVRMHPTFHTGNGTWSATAVTGIVGTEATYAEVEQFGELIRRPLDAPLRRFVVAVDGTAPAVVRVLDHHGAVLGQIAVPAGGALPARGARALSVRPGVWRREAVEPPWLSGP